MIILNRQHPIRNPDGCAIAQKTDKRIVVADFEFQTDYEKYLDYLKSDGSSAHPKPRWPYAKIVCGSWVEIQFPAGDEAKPVVGPFQSLCAPEMEEIDIANHFFTRVLGEAADDGSLPRLVTYAGDFKDNEVLRRVAMCWGITLPPQLRSTDPRCPMRLDLCEDCFTEQIGGVHLSEYAQAQGLPGKLYPGLDIGKHIEAGDWETVEEQCAHDVLLTAIIAARRLASCGEIGQTGKACARAIIDRYCERAPSVSTRKWKAWRDENLGHREILTLRGRPAAMFRAGRQS
jgi:hypothetical protein